MNTRAWCRACLKKQINCGGIFEVDKKLKTLEELRHRTQNPDLWNNPKEMEKVNRELAIVERTCNEWQGTNPQHYESSSLRSGKTRDTLPSR